MEDESLIEGIGEEVPQEVNEEEEEEEDEHADDENDETVDDPDSVINDEKEDDSLPSCAEMKKVLHLKNSRTKRGTPRLQESSLAFLDEIDNL